MKQRKLSFLFVLLMLVVGVACAPQPTVVEGSEPTEGAAEDIEPTVQDASICEEGFRLFDHDDLAGDPICIPEDPDRVLALEIGALETALLADKNVVGTANWLHSEIPVLMPELAPALDGIMDTGYPANLEVVLEADPDIILGVEGDIDIEAGNEIAPVVMPVAGLENDWQRNMAFWSEVLGTQELYADMLANYEARINEFQMALTGDPEISLIGTSSYGTYMWLEDSAPGEILADAELERPESQAVSGDEALERYDAERWILLSDERLDLADADHIFVYSYATTDPETTETENAALEEFKANPVWTTLSANQADQVHYVGPHWWRAQTYLLANKVVNDLFTHLTDASPDTPILNFEAVGEETSSDACDDGLRAVTDALDTTVCAPEQPERIISLTDGDTDALMALGVDPVGISNGRGSQTPPNYLLDYVGEDYVSVGAFFQPNLEMVLELEPDLILFSYGDLAEPELLDQLSRIAPVFVPVSRGGTWQDLFLSVGEAMNMDAEVDTYLAAYDERVDTIGSSIEPQTQFIIARWAAEGPQVMAPYIFAPAILQDLGMIMPDEIPELQEGHAHSSPLSLETIDILDADWAFVGTLQPEGDAADALADVFDNPLFQQLAVVQNDQVVVVDGSIWTSSGGPLAANLVLDVIEESVLGVEE